MSTLSRSPVRVVRAALAAGAESLPAYAHVNNAFVPPLDPWLLPELTAGRMKRLDGFGDTYAGVDDETWSPSGSVLRK